jgi:hypothetical protein
VGLVEEMRLLCRTLYMPVQYFAALETSLTAPDHHRSSTHMTESDRAHYEDLIELRAEVLCRLMLAHCARNRFPTHALYQASTALIGHEIIRVRDSHDGA